MLKRTHKCGELRAEDVDEKTVVSGWVANRRDHGGVIFIDLRDRYGVVQVVFRPEHNKELHQQAGALRSEYCISVGGQVARRPEDMENPDLATGQIEILADQLEIHGTSDTPPFEITGAGNVSQEVRFENRFLDLRRPEIQQNLLFRHKVMQLTRQFLDARDFVEVETPFLTKSTPEGARDYLVPSRVNPGSFYALPQSPQLFKQLLMVSGMDRYFQIVRCFRDEDLRAQRQPEFTQIDMEMSFVDEEDIMACTEELVQGLFKDLRSVDLSPPLPRISYTEAMRRYGTDAPDLRFGMEIHDITDIADECEFRVFSGTVADGGQVRGINVPDGASLPRSEIDGLIEWVKQFGAGGLAWFKVSDGMPESSIAKFFNEDELRAVAKRLDVKDGDLLLFVADRKSVCDQTLAQLRLHVARKMGLIPEDTFEACWVVEAPAFEKDEKTGRVSCPHHPFTAPREADIEKLDTDPDSVRTRSYDLVVNGVELGGGSIRISNRDLQIKILKMLGFTEKEAHERFGFLLDALRYGPPPHGGIAFGLDRIVAVLLGLDDIRESIPFPKTQRAVCPLTGAPTAVDPAQLKELGISIDDE